MLKNLVLDIGNVICEWNAQKLVASVFDDKSEHTQAIADTIGHEDWLNLDRGTLTKADAISRAQQRSDLNPDSIAQIYENLPASLTPFQSSVDAMYELAEQGVPIYILSNMHEHSWQYLHRTFPFWETCKGVVVSCDTGLVKPESEIYDHVCERFSLNPAECVFVDDMPENVEAAIACGWQSVQLTDPNEGGNLFRSIVAGFG
ncbi:MAG: HAD family phosphatase [Gammaproteobacteria bacterium]|nr:HAD family phosphatase [Gammaproteobacteria bacterium]